VRRLSFKCQQADLQFRADAANGPLQALRKAKNCSRTRNDKALMRQENGTHTPSNHEVTNRAPRLSRDTRQIRWI
jgi:hypothetical protein